MLRNSSIRWFKQYNFLSTASNI